VHALSLEYHDIVEADGFDRSGYPGAGPASYKLTVDNFEQHLESMRQRLSDRTPGRVDRWCPARAADPPVFLTFDDGGVSAHAAIADALERHGWPGHFFVTAGRIGTPAFLSAAQIRDLRRRGHVIGTHSYSHPTRMGACTHEQLVREWRVSVEALSDILGELVVTASVPGGFYTRPVAETAAEQGIERLFSSAPSMSCQRVGNCWVLGRYTMRRWSRPSTAAALVSGSLAPRATQWIGYNALTLLRTIGGDRYTRLRQTFWAGQA
jgi:peptidoglycan/xylan/chitin deacetylase (PgdA/CDA1 family)